MTKLLSAHSLSKRFAAGAGRDARAEIVAVDRVDVEIAEGEIVALVGESGSGKSTLARCLLRLVEPDSGTIEFAGRDLLELSGRELRTQRREFQLVFQDSVAALDPRVRVGAALAEPLRCLRLVPGAAMAAAVRSLAARVGLEPAHLGRFPHELSGGERQRVGIARALATSPRLLIADEPVSALDVSLRAQILNLLLDLCRQDGLALLLILHDLSLADRLADRVLVMYHGRIVEQGESEKVLRRPLHPYTQELLTCVPQADPRHPLSAPVSRVAQYRADRGGAVGCAFASRCPIARDRCLLEAPVLRELGSGRDVACHFAGMGEQDGNFFNQSS